MTVDFTQGPPVPEPVEPEFVPPPAPPCEIHFKSGKVFVVDELDSWQWHDRGMFATGRFASADKDAGEQDLLIPNSSIDYVEFDFAAIQAPEVGPGE